MEDDGPEPGKQYNDLNLFLYRLIQISKDYYQYY